MPFSDKLTALPPSSKDGGPSLGQNCIMDVDPSTAYAYLDAFARLEFTLKRVPQFLRTGLNDNAEVHWTNVNLALKSLQASEFVDLVSAPTRERVLGGRRDRPRVQKVQLRQNGERIAKFRDQPLVKDSRFIKSDAVALLTAAKRVRNNLFHGGKEEPNGGNEAWVLAAMGIVVPLLHLDWRRMGLELDQAS